MRAFPSNLAAAAVAAICTASPCGAVTLEVAPTTVMLRQDEKASVLYVNNYGAAAVSVQIESFDWSESSGEDRLAPSDTLMASPPIAKIPPQGKQIVRLIATPGTRAYERSFRLLVSQLPEPARRSDHSIQVLAQFSVPAFAEGATRGVAKIVWEAAAVPDGLRITASNQGTRHAKLADLVMIPGGGAAEPLKGRGLDYILAESARSWDIACAHCGIGDAIRIEGRDEASDAKFDVPIVVR